MSLSVAFPTPSARVGVLVPPSNPVVELELRFFLPEDIGLHSARFPVFPNTTLDQRNLAYLDHYEPCQAGFGQLALDAIIVGLTGPSYRLLPDGDRAQCARLSAARGGPTATASLAILEALEALGARRIALVSPYPDWLTAKAAAFWTAAGYAVTQVVGISEEFRAYELTSDEVVAALARVDESACDAVVMSGTGMLTAPASLLSADRSPAPFLSSNLCSAWWASRVLGRPAGAALRRAAPALAATLDG